MMRLLLNILEQINVFVMESGPTHRRRFMKTKEIIIASSGQGMDEALLETERIGVESGLTPKEVLRLRLLTEELFGMMRSILGLVLARFQVEEENNTFSIRLDSTVQMTQEMRKQLMSVSSEGRNAAAVGFMGKLRDMISVALLPNESGLSILSGFSMGMMSTVRNTDAIARQANEKMFSWSMSKYKSEVEGLRDEDREAEEAWDELEKSIVANIADEVSVLVQGSDVKIIITKAF